MSTRIFHSLPDIRIEARVLLFRGSEDVQTAQSHPISGTPVEVPDPRMVIVVAVDEGDRSILKTPRLALRPLITGL